MRSDLVYFRDVHQVLFDRILGHSSFDHVTTYRTFLAAGQV
jgi:hypothetical protein